LQQDIQKEKYRMILVDFFGEDKKKNTFAPQDSYMQAWKSSKGITPIYSCKTFFDDSSSNQPPSFSNSENLAYFTFDLKMSFKADQGRSSLEEVFSSIETLINSQRTN
jgi:hypothetical protein